MLQEKVSSKTSAQWQELSICQMCIYAEISNAAIYLQEGDTFNLVYRRQIGT